MRSFHTLTLVAAVLSLTACGLDDSGDDSQKPGAESSAPIGRASDAPGCHVDEDCNDGNACTADTCDVSTGICSHESTSVTISLHDYNLFLLGDYNLGTDVEGKVAAAGTITMDNFSVGHRVPDSDIANTLVAGNNLRLTNGGVWGDAWYGGSYSADQTVVYPRGTVARGSPIDFTAREAELRNLSSQLASLTANGTTTRETWGGIMLRGTDAQRNVFDVNASDFTGATLWSIEAPAGSFVVVNIRGSSATFTGFGIQFSGGINQHGVLYNFVDTTSITAEGFGFWGTVLAPRADIHFTNGSFDGGIYARSMTGNAEGHVNPLDEHNVCQAEPPPPPPPDEPDGGNGGGTPDGGNGGGEPDGGNGGGTPDGGNGGGEPDGGNGGGTPDGGNDGGTPDGGGHHDGDGCPNDDHGGGGHDDDDDGHGGGGHHDGDGCPNDDHGGGGHDDDDDGHGGGGHHDGDGCPNDDHGGGGHDDDDDGHGGGGHHDGDGCPNDDHGGSGHDDDDDGHGGGGHHDGDGCPNDDHGGGGHDDDDDGHGGGGGGSHDDDDDGHGGGGGGHHDGDGCPNNDHDHGGGSGHDDDDGHGGGGGGGGHDDDDDGHGGGGGGGGHGGGGHGGDDCD